MVYMSQAEVWEGNEKKERAVEKGVREERKRGERGLNGRPWWDDGE